MRAALPQVSERMVKELQKAGVRERVYSAGAANFLSRDLLVNSLTAIDGRDRQYFNELRSTVVSCRIFIRSQSLIAR